MTFKMKRKPSKPRRVIDKRISRECDDFENLQEVLDWASDGEDSELVKITDPKEIFIIDSNYKDRYDYDYRVNLEFAIYWTESEETFARRAEAYENLLVSYNQWLIDNKDEIKEYHRLKDAEKNGRRLATLAAEEKKIKERLDEIIKEKTKL